MARARPEIQAVVEKHEIGRKSSDFGHHAVERLVFVLAQLSADGIHFKKTEVVILHQTCHHVGTLLGLGFAVAETVGSAPYPQPRVHIGRLSAQRTEAFGELPFETVGLSAAIHFGTVDGSCVKCVDVEFHAILVVEPAEEVEINPCLLCCSTFVGVVDPREVL